MENEKLTFQFSSEVRPRSILSVEVMTIESSTRCVTTTAPKSSIFCVGTLENIPFASCLVLAVCVAGMISVFVF
jgi:hypothetical protein